MAKKQVVNNLSSISDEMFNSLTKINNNNVKEFFNSFSLFVILNIDGKNSKSYEIVNQFSVKDQMIKDTNIQLKYIFDNGIKCTNVKIFTSETNDDFKIRISDCKKIVETYIIKGNIYGIKV